MIAVWGVRGVVIQGWVDVGNATNLDISHLTFEILTSSDSGHVSFFIWDDTLTCGDNSARNSGFIPWIIAVDIMLYAKVGACKKNSNFAVEVNCFPVARNEFPREELKCVFLLLSVFNNLKNSQQWRVVYLKSAPVRVFDEQVETTQSKRRRTGLVEPQIISLCLPIVYL